MDDNGYVAFDDSKQCKNYLNLECNYASLPQKPILEDPNP